MLFMASGKLVRDYTLLVRYFEILEGMGLDKSVSVPTSDDINCVVRAVARGHLSLLEAMYMLINRFIPRVNGEAARKAVKEVIGEEVDERIAVEIVARDLAGWALEIAENMNLIRIDASVLRW